MATWQVQSAKQRFSEVIRAAEAGEPQHITRHGERVAVIIDIQVVDGLLAATAIERDLVLVTRNVRDLEGTGAQVLNPFVD